MIPMNEQEPSTVVDILLHKVVFTGWWWWRWWGWFHSDGNPILAEAERYETRL